MRRIRRHPTIGSTTRSSLAHDARWVSPPSYEIPISISQLMFQMLHGTSFSCHQKKWKESGRGFKWWLWRSARHSMGSSRSKGKRLRIVSMWFSLCFNGSRLFLCIEVVAFHAFVLQNSYGWKQTDALEHQRSMLISSLVRLGCGSPRKEVLARKKSVIPLLKAPDLFCAHCDQMCALKRLWRRCAQMHHSFSETVSQFSRNRRHGSAFWTCYQEWLNPSRCHNSHTIVYDRVSSYTTRRNTVVIHEASNTTLYDRTRSYFLLYTTAYDRVRRRIRQFTSIVMIVLGSALLYSLSDDDLPCDFPLNTKITVLKRLTGDLLDEHEQDDYTEKQHIR